MSARQPAVEEFASDSTRYAIGFALLYFLCGAVTVDIVLQKQWGSVPSSLKRKVKNIQEANEAHQSNEKSV